MIFHYRYITESSFSPGVEWHFFKLRAIPCSNVFQQVREARLEVSPSCQWLSNRDGLGNEVQWGTVAQRHESFRVLSAGTIEQTRPYAIEEEPAPYYLAETRLTACTDTMRQRARSLGDAASIMHYVHGKVAYKPMHTTTTTTAADLWADPQGVCQDFAHLMIALCRAVGLHARYVNGLIEGEGETHAWVEVSDGKVWHAYDPTHNLLPEWGYIKIAHGRDADDCPTNRGRFYSLTTEWQRVACKVERLQ